MPPMPVIMEEITKGTMSIFSAFRNSVPTSS
jgi:hypothetical protein